jgi:RND family efflux transporter MFP subunit
MKSISSQKVLFLLLCCFFFQHCQRDKVNQSTGERLPIPVTVAQINTMDVPHSLKQVGTLQANETVMVKSETKGKIREISFEEGKAVKEGDLLIKLDDKKIKAEIMRLQAQMKQFTIQLDNTKKTLQRKKRLLKGDVLSEQEYDDLVAKKGIEETLIQQYQAQLIIAQDQLKDTEIGAPFDGITSERLVSMGDYIAVGDPIVKVVQTDPLKLSFSIPEKFKEKVHIKMPVTISVESFPGEFFTGTVYFVSPDVDVETRNFLGYQIQILDSIRECLQ